MKIHAFEPPWMEDRTCIAGQQRMKFALFPGLFCDFLFGEPLDGLLRVIADQKNFLNRSRAIVKALKPRGGGVLHSEIGRGFSSPNFDSTWNDARDEWALADDAIQDSIQTAHSAVLSLNPSKLH